MAAWALRLPLSSGHQLVDFRSESAIEVCQTDRYWWLRGTGLSAGLQDRLRQVYAAEGFDWLAEGHLRPWGKRLAIESLPAGPWVQVAKIVSLELSPTRWPGEFSEQADLRLRRTPDVRPERVLVTSFDEWQQFAQTAAEFRLARWRYAVNSKGVVTIHGDPIPPLPGERFFEQAGIAILAGWQFDPQMPPDVLATAWRQAPGELILARPEPRSPDRAECQEAVPYRIERIGRDYFVQAVRSSLPMTAEALRAPEVS